MSKKVLITSALPYVDGDLHLGNFVGCFLPSDIYARFCRARGDDVLYVCGADEHGTKSLIAAKKEGLPVLEYNDKWVEKQKKALAGFNLSFDFYGRTHTEKHERLMHEIFSKLEEKGLIEERETVQPFGIEDGMFLADAYVRGICPKCGYENANGNECPKCGAAFEVEELKNPRSALSGGRVELRPTKNLFFLASKIEPQWKKWLAAHAPHWSKYARDIARGWANEGLRDTSITRDLPWGVPVNKPGYENKVFYVWFDAPWGYVSISQAANPNWEDWWKNPNAHYAQFMGKDNVKFHSVFFPEQQLAAGDDWKTVDMLKGMSFLNFEGGKFSKSEDRGIFMDQALEDAPADAWRYAVIASAPETDDTDFTIQRFADIVNKDLNGMLGNFVSRVCKLSEKHFANNVPNSIKGNPQTAKHGQKLEENINKNFSDLTAALDGCEFRKAIEALRAMWAAGNEFMSESEPWELVKSSPEAAGQILNECFQLIDFYARVSAPFIPATSEKMLAIFGTKRDLLWPEKYDRRIADGESFTVPDNLFERIDNDKILEMIKKYTA
ncbi:MAG: methionine--tRNA ligase [Rickettsiales bacterium]|jgi:methionyl-tRNA synthetase|nr:methionine--tRNA ligase [Rickettsiales bacterium]